MLFAWQMCEQRVHLWPWVSWLHFEHSSCHFPISDDFSRKSTCYAGGPMKTAQCPCARTTARQLRLFSVEFALRNACYSDSQCIFPFGEVNSIWMRSPYKLLAARTFQFINAIALGALVATPAMSAPCGWITAPYENDWLMVDLVLPSSILDCQQDVMLTLVVENVKTCKCGALSGCSAWMHVLGADLNAYLWMNSHRLQVFRFTASKCLDLWFIAI